MEFSKVTNLEELACFIEKLPDNDDADAEHGFDMNAVKLSHTRKHPCGSACCIGGWAKILIYPNLTLSMTSALQRLNPKISQDELLNLAFEYPDGDISPKQGAAAIRILDRTGKCDWEEAMKSND